MDYRTIARARKGTYVLAGRNGRLVWGRVTSYNPKKDTMTIVWGDEERRETKDLSRLNRELDDVSLFSSYDDLLDALNDL